MMDNYVIDIAHFSCWRNVLANIFSISVYIQLRQYGSWNVVLGATDAHGN